jgi:hypothetical protein
MSAETNGEVKLADFDLDQWIDGTQGITREARMIQRGDLLAEVDRLERLAEIVQKIPAAERGVGDPTPETVKGQLDTVRAQLWDSMLVVHVQDRTEARRGQIRDRLRKQGVDRQDIGLHLIADAIVRVETPDGRVVPLPEEGFPAGKLRAIRDRMGDSALFDLIRVYGEVTSQAPAVSAPLSRAPSSTGGGSTSR